MFRTYRSLSLHTILLLTVTLLISLAASAQTSNLEKSLNKELKKFSLATIDSNRAKQQVGQNSRLTLRAENRDFELILTPNDLRSSHYHAEETGPNGVKEVQFGGVNTFKGKVESLSAATGAR